MKLAVRLVLSASLITSGVLVAVAGPTLAQEEERPTITVVCTLSLTANNRLDKSFEFSRTVSAHAAWGVSRAIERLNSATPSPWGARWECTVTDIDGEAVRPDTVRRKIVTCERGDRIVAQRRIPRAGSKATVALLNRFHKAKGSAVSCSLS